MNLWRRVFAERRRTMLALSVLLLVNAAVLGLAVVPLKSLVAVAAEEATQAGVNLAQAQTKLKQAHAARDSRDRAEADLKRFYAEILPADFASARHIAHTEIARIGQEAGLKPGAREFDPVRLRDSQLGEFKTDVAFTGDYQSIRKFIYQVETAQSFLVIRSMAMGQSSQQKGAPPGTVAITLELSTYYLGDK